MTVKTQTWSLHGQVAVVAGAGRGIGAATASALAECGAQVIVVDIDEGRAESVAGEIAADGGKATGVACDITAPDAVDELIGGIPGRFGSLDVVVNNAGGMTAYAAWGDTVDWSLEDWDMIVNRNLRYVFLSCRAAIRTMGENGGGAIVNLSSISGVVSAPRHAAYGAAKAGVVNLTASLAVEAGPLGVRVNAVAPGAILTAANAAVMPEEQIETFRHTIPLGRAGAPEDIANVVAFLASPAAAYVTGQTLLADGGASAVYPLKMHSPAS